MRSLPASLRSRLMMRLAALVACAAALLGPTVVQAQISVLGQTVQEHASGPGDLQTGTVLVANASAEPQTVRVYLTDYWFDAAGETRYDPPATRPRSNAGWIAAEASQVIVPPGGTLPVRYTVRTPAGLTAGGTFWSLLMIEPIARGAGNVGSGQVAVSATVRYAVQIVNHVTPPGTTPSAAAAEISAPRTVVSKDGVLSVEFDLKNPGEAGYRPELSLELIDESGKSAGTYKQRRGLLYPSTSLRQRFECRGVPRGTYKAVIVADTGDDVFGRSVAYHVVRCSP